MTAEVNVFYFGELGVLPIAAAQKTTFDGMLQLPFPPLGRDQLSVETGAASSTTGSNAPAGTRCALIQVVTAGARVRWELARGPEVNTALRTADGQSPIIEGERVVGFGEGWRLSMREAS